jgi:hypothetical protein
MNAMATWRSLTVAACLALAAGLGCTQPDRARDDLGPTPRLMMPPETAEQARQWYDAWLNEPDTTGDTDVETAGLIGVAARSDQTGYSRALCRLALSSAEAKLIRSDGPIRIILVARPTRPDEQIVGAWFLTAQQAGEHFRYGRLPGYQLDLYWPRMAATSVYRLIVRWDSPDGQARQTTMISFEDTFGYDIRTENPFK